MSDPVVPISRAHTSNGASQWLEAPDPLQETWREFFRRSVRETPRFSMGQRFLADHIASTLRRLIPPEARVLEAGPGRGDVLAQLPNPVRHAVDICQDAVEYVNANHPGITARLDDARYAKLGEHYEAIVCDRVCHTVPDIQMMLANLRDHLHRDGRVYLIAFNYLWERPLALAEQLGFKFPAPPANWLSDSDYQNLFHIVGLEEVKHEDHLLLPAPVPFVSTLINKYLAAIPGLHLLTMYRVYVLRKAPDAPAPRKATVSVVIPARNESGNIENAVRRTPVMGAGTEIIFVEGNSTDDTRARIDEVVKAYKGPLKLSAYVQPGKGKGDAVREGFKHATGDMLMILDADLTVPPEDLPKFYDVLARGLTDYTHGTRLVYPMEGKAMRFLNKLGNIGFSTIFSWLLNQTIKDTLCGTKVLWRKDYERLAANRHYFGDFDPFGDFDLIFGAAKLNLRMLEIPIRYRDRTYGETNISRFRHGWMLLKMSVVAARKLKFV